jgi:hypothetical protein
MAFAAVAALAITGPCQAKEPAAAKVAEGSQAKPAVAAPAAHAESPAPSLAVGQTAPDFELTDINGKTHRLSDYTAQGKTVVLEWFSPACPVCVAYYSAPQGADGKPAGAAPMVATHEQIAGDNLVWLLVNSSGTGKPGSELEANQKALADWHVPFPLLLDADGKVGHAYGAQRTPHMMVIDPKGRLIYRGSADEGGRGAPGTGMNFVVSAVQAAAEGKLPLVLETQAVG